MSLPAITTAPISFSGSGDNIVVAAITGPPAQGIWVWQMFFVVGAGTNITIKDGASNALTGAMPFTTDGAMFTAVSREMPWFKTARGNAFIINSSSAVQVSGEVYYSLF